MIKKILLLIFALIILSGAHQLKASGFALYELGARASALAGAFVARADDTSAVYYNPAGIAFLDGFRIKTNIQFGTLNTTAFSPNADTHFKSNPYQIQGLYYVTWSPFDKITIGFGRFTPYSTDMDWGGEWPGKDFCISSQLISYYYRPTVAVKLTKGFALGIGVDFVFSKAEWSHYIDFPTENIPQVSTSYFMDSRHHAEGTGVGFVAGLLWKIGKRLHIGGKYQHKTVINAKGKNTFHDPFIATSNPSIPGPENKLVKVRTLMDSYYALQNVNLRISYPTEIALGLMFLPVDRLMLLFDFQWDKWSEAMIWTFQSDKTDADLSPEFMETYGAFFGMVPDYGKQSADLKWKDTWNFKFGIEYAISSVLALRAGYAHSPSAVDGSFLHPIIPDLNHNIISIGAGYEGPLFSVWDDKKMSNFTFDLFMQYMFSNKQMSSLPGFRFSYDTDRFVAGVGVGFDF